MSSKLLEEVHICFEAIHRTLGLLICKAESDEKIRLMLLARLQNLVNTVETPAEAIWRMIMQVQYLPHGLTETC